MLRGDFDAFQRHCADALMARVAAALDVPASAIEARQRTDPEEGLDPKGESAVPKGDAQ
jgi:hypothetical protein